MKAADWEAIEARICAFIGAEPAMSAIIPEQPRPIIEGHGWEATDWSDCPLAHAYGVSGETFHKSARPARRRD
jgi:hypothetical protein